MLRFLRIRNLAVIDAVEVEFDPGFNVLTGETGAGKSILVEAVGLLLGGRASADLVRTGEDIATIEAIFESGEATELIVRREISARAAAARSSTARWRRPAALKDLSDAPRRAARPARTSDAARSARRTSPLLDAFAGTRRARRPTSRAAWTRRARRCASSSSASRMDGREKAARLDLIAFQLGEIEKAAPKPGEDEELAATQAGARQRRARRAAVRGELRLALRQRRRGAGGARRRLEAGRRSSPRSIRSSRRTSRRATASSRSSRISRCFLREYADGIDASPARLQQVEDRLALLERLKRKYGPTLADVIEKGDALARERESADAAAGERAEDSISGARRGAGRVPAAARELSRSAARRRPPDVRAATSRRCSRSWRWRGRGSRSGSTRRAAARSAWSERGIDAGGVLRLAEPGRGSRGRSRASSPAASCRGSCWR